MGVLENVDVLGNARCTTIIGDNLGDKINNVTRLDTYSTQLEAAHNRLGGNVDIYGLVVTYLADPCALDGVDDEGVSAVLGGFVQIEIVPQQLVDGLGAGKENRSGVVWDIWVDGGTCGREKHRIVSRIVRSVVG